MFWNHFTHSSGHAMTVDGDYSRQAPKVQISQTKAPKKCFLFQVIIYDCFVWGTETEIKPFHHCCKPYELISFAEHKRRCFGAQCLTSINCLVTHILQNIFWLNFIFGWIILLKFNFTDFQPNWLHICYLDREIHVYLAAIKSFDSSSAFMKTSKCWMFLSFFISSWNIPLKSPCGENQAFNVVYMSMWCF